MTSQNSIISNGAKFSFKLDASAGKSSPVSVLKETGSSKELLDLANNRFVGDAGHLVILVTMVVTIKFFVDAEAPLTSCTVRGIRVFNL